MKVFFLFNSHFPHGGVKVCDYSQGRQSHGLHAAGDKVSPARNDPPYAASSTPYLPSPCARSAILIQNGKAIFPVRFAWIVQCVQAAKGVLMLCLTRYQKTLCGQRYSRPDPAGEITGAFCARMCARRCRPQPRYGSGAMLNAAVGLAMADAGSTHGWCLVRQPKV